jgi:hypothetical protein
MNDADRLHEDRESLWLLTFGPAIWFAHFVLCYAIVSIWCSKVARDAGPLGGAQVAIAALTVAAMAGIVVVGWMGWTRHTYGGNASPPHDYDSPEDRHRFLGFSTLLLASLSGIATLYVAAAAFLVGTCR